MIKALTLILLISLVVSQQAEEADIQVTQEAAPLTPARGAPMVGGLSSPTSSDVKKATGKPLSEQEKLLLVLEQRSREKFRSQYKDEELQNMSYRTQIVAGTNYFLKFERSNGDTVQFIYFIPLPGNQVQGEDNIVDRGFTITPKST